MPRGGARKNAGRKNRWPSGCKFKDTKTIRVPKAIFSEVMKYAKKLDEESLLEKDTKSKGVLQGAQDANTTPELFPVKRFDKSLTTLDSGIDKEQLGTRLKVSPETVRRTLGKKRNIANGFETWSRDRDPDGITWKYDSELKLFFPV